MKDRVGAVLGRKALRQSLSDFIDGLLSDAERKTGWLLAEHAGLTRPYRMQSLLGRSRWDADPMLAEVRAYVIEALGHPDGVLVVDEMGFVKKGMHSVGVGRRYSGTAGRIENCQVGVFLAYAARHRHMTLVMAAAAFLAKLAADLRRAADVKQNEKSPGPQIAA